MNIQTLPIDTLRPAPYNPRVPLRPGSAAYRRLERSIDEFDLVQPIVWNELTGHVVAGHQRLEILKVRGITEVPAVVVSLSIEREKALNVALNNANVGSDWDADRLLGLLGELSALPEFDATLTGFDADELNELLLAPAAELPQEPDEPDENETVRVTIEIDPDEWDSVRPDLDEFIADHNLTAHVRMPD
ncbi:MAG: ParB N-terminal domain-containing protein [Planctomycetaceae bacterium]